MKIMKIKGIRDIPRGHLPPVLEDSMGKYAEIELAYTLTVTRYWDRQGRITTHRNAIGGRVEEVKEAETPGEAYKIYWKLRKQYPRCEITAEQCFNFHGGGAVPISLTRLKDLSSQE